MSCSAITFYQMRYSADDGEISVGSRGRRIWLTCLFGGGTVLLGVGLYWFLDAESLVDRAKLSPQLTKVLVQRYELKNRTGRVQRNLYFWVRGVVSHTPTGKLIKSESNRDFHEQMDHLGNRILTFSIDHIPPYGSVIVEDKAYIATGARHVDGKESPSLLDGALRAAPLIESADPRIMRLARSFDQVDEIQRARAIFDWVVENIRLSNYQSRPLGALKTLQVRKGDCTEVAHLYAALARASGLPVRVMAGYRFRGNALMRPDDLHNWVEVYLKGHWRIVDAHARSFLEDEAGYIATLRLDMHGKGELQGHQRYKVSNTAIEVRQF